MPDNLPLPSPWNYNQNGQIHFTIVNEDKEIPIDAFVYPVFMSKAQSYDAIGMSLGYTVTGEASSDAFDTASRLVMDFTNPENPNANDGSRLIPKDLIIEADGGFAIDRENASIMNSTYTGYITIFDVVWEDAIPGQIEQWNASLAAYYAHYNITDIPLLSPDTKFPSKESGLGIFSAKAAEIIWMLTYHPLIQNKCGYIHILWVENGVKIFAGAFLAAGYSVYTGRETIALTPENKMKRVALLTGTTKEAQREKILTLYNSVENREGEYLQVIIGSSASAISLSFSNSQWYMESSSDYNFTTGIQAQGRVFRANSLSWLKERRVFTAYMMVFPAYMDSSVPQGEVEYMNNIRSGKIVNKLYPSIQEWEQSGSDMPYTPTNAYTVEAKLYSLAYGKNLLIQVVNESLHECSIERAILDFQNEQADTHTHALLYGQSTINSIEKNVRAYLMDNWSIGTGEDMYTMKALSDMMSRHQTLSSYNGPVFPICASASGITLATPDQIEDNTSIAGRLDFASPLSQIYDQSLFVGSYSADNPQLFSMALMYLENMWPRGDNPDAFNITMLLLSLESSFKVSLLENTLVRKKIGIQALDMFAAYISSWILMIFGIFWMAFENNTVSHALKYAVRPSSYESKIGVNMSIPRQIRQIKVTDIDAEWHEIHNRAEEVSIANIINENIIKEEKIAIMNGYTLFGSTHTSTGRPYGYYIILSLADGVMRIREIHSLGTGDNEDLRKIKTYPIGDNINPELVHILSVIAGPTNLSRRSIFHGAVKHKIIISR